MKKIAALLLTLCLIFTFVGCSKGNASNTDSEIASLQKQVQDLQKENTDLKSKLSSSLQVKDNTSSINSASAQSSETSSESNNTLKFNQNITIDGVCTFSVLSAKFTTKVEPSKPSDYYTYYQVKDTNNIYIDIILKYKNLFSSGKQADEVGDVKVKYNDQYDYTSFSAIEEKGGGDLTYSNITDIDPLTTSTLHYICEVPKEVKSSGKSVVATLTISDQTYQLKIK